MLSERREGCTSWVDHSGGECLRMPGSRATVRMLHTSDVHLDRAGDKACDCLVGLVNLAIERDVDLVLIAGDLFDHNKIKGDLIDFTMTQLRRLPMPVVILPGNHDCLVPGSVYERLGIDEDDDNIRLIRAPEGETLDLPDQGVAVWGKSIASHDGDIRPLAGLPQPQSNGRWSVAVAHGYYVSGDTPLFPSLHITADEIAGSGWDYIALGHVPTFRCVCDKPAAYYPGSPTVTGTSALVELDEENGVRVTRCQL